LPDCTLKVEILEHRDIFVYWELLENLNNEQLIK
jgi:hypothetical protein